MKLFDDKFKQIKYLIDQAKNILIVSHISPDGDNIGSSVAFFEYLKDLGKKAIIINEDSVPTKYQFLTKNINFKQFNETITNHFDTVIMLDIGEYNRCGVVSKLIGKDAKIINIDHHISNSGFGDISLVAPQIASCAQIVFHFLQSVEYNFSDLSVEALLSGIISDTGGFKYGNANSLVLSDCSQLLELNKSIKISELIDKIMFSRSFEELKEITEILNSKTSIDDNGVLYTFYDSKKYPNCDNDYLLDIINGISDAKITLYARKVEDNKIKASLRTKTNFDLSLFASNHNGGGHPKASGITFTGNEESFKDLILKDLKNEFKKFMNL